MKGYEWCRLTSTGKLNMVDKVTPETGLYLGADLRVPFKHEMLGLLVVGTD